MIILIENIKLTFKIFDLFIYFYGVWSGRCAKQLLRCPLRVVASTPIVSLHTCYRAQPSVPAGTCHRRPGRSPPCWRGRRCRCHLQPPAHRSPSPTPTSSRIPQWYSAPWNASCPTDFPFKKTCKVLLSPCLHWKKLHIPMKSVVMELRAAQSFKWQKTGKFHTMMRVVWGLINAADTPEGGLKDTSLRVENAKIPRNSIKLTAVKKYQLENTNGAVDFLLEPYLRSLIYLVYLTS